MKRILVLFVLFTAVGSLAAFDFGGYLDNTTGFADAPPGSESDLALVQDTTLALWARTKLGVWTVDGQASYTYTPRVPVLLDLDRLTLAADVLASEAGATTVGLTLGRTTFRDATGVILNHSLDGLQLQVNQRNGSFRLGLGTTALLIKPSNNILLSRLDALDLAEEATYFAPPRLIADLEYRLLEVFAGQHLSLGVTVQEDLRPQSELTPERTDTASPTAGGQVDTQYVTLGVSGSVMPGLFQRTSYTLNSGRRLEYVPDVRSPTGSWYLYQPFLAHMIATELSYFLPEVLNSRARLFGQYSTGDTAWSDTFVALSPSGYSDVFTLQPGNSAHIGVSYSLRPLAVIGLDVLQTELKSVTYFRSTGSGAVSEPSVDPASTGGYAGTDVNLIVTAVPLSDVRIVLKGGVFVPNDSVRTAQNQNVDYQVTLQGVLRF
jgi:hypothetical protein